MMDYRGQELCEQLNQIINITAGVIGFGYGWYVQSFWITFLFCCGGLLLSSIVCIPDWPFYNKHPVPWQPAYIVPGSTDPVTGGILADTNTVCGTCTCGGFVHGIHCDQHEQNINQKQESETNASSPISQPATVEIQAIKVRSSNKKK